MPCPPEQYPVFLYHESLLLGNLYKPLSLIYQKEKRRSRKNCNPIAARTKITLLLYCHSVMSNSLQLHGLQHTRIPCLSSTPGACSNSCPLSQWSYLTISSSVTRFSSHLQSFPASWSFPMSQLFTSGGRSMELKCQYLSFQWILRVDFL